MDLLLLHGAIGSSEQLLPLANKLKENFKVYTLDFTGHGASENTSDAFSIELFANDVVDWMSLNKITSINIFGYSMGGYVALYLAIQHPTKVKRVFTLATKFNWTPEIAQGQIKLLNPEKILEKLPAYAKILEHRHQLFNWKNVLEKTSAMMVDLGKNAPLNTYSLRSLNCPVLVAVGDNDKMVSIDETEQVCKDMPNAKFLIIPKTTHNIEEVDVLTLSSLLNNFFNATNNN